MQNNKEGKDMYNSDLLTTYNIMNNKSMEELVAIVMLQLKFMMKNNTLNDFLKYFSDEYRSGEVKLDASRICVEL